jgi:NAD(P)-dependent dehydrogenase (short-subunit alcohol dehydrogenase family)
VTTASLGGLVSDVRAPIGAYVASKYAPIGYSDMLRAELAGDGVGVIGAVPWRRLLEPDGDDHRCRLVHQGRWQ